MRSLDASAEEQAVQLEQEIIATIKRHSIHLSPGCYLAVSSFLGQPSVCACAIGSAALIKAKNLGDLSHAEERIHDGTDEAVSAKHIADLTVTSDALRRMEAGFELARCRFTGAGGAIDVKDPFYLLGLRLRRYWIEKQQSDGNRQRELREGLRKFVDRYGICLPKELPGDEPAKECER